MGLARVNPFAIEQWMDKHEINAKYNLAESCVASISLDDLQALSDDKASSPLRTSSKKLTYGAIRGSHELRTNLAHLYSPPATTKFSGENILITPGAIAANLVVLYALVGRGDHVICHYPTYQQLYEVPASLGADVSLWKTSQEKQWILDMDELRVLLQPNTRMIIINNPQNPTGAIIPKDTLRNLITIAEERNIIILSDEVYRPLFHSGPPSSGDTPPSMVDTSYLRAIVTGSLSKAYSLAGLRVGWISSHSLDILAACAQARDYTTISVSHLDDQIAAYALSEHCIHNLLSRSFQLAKRNLDLLEQFTKEHRWACEWVKPAGGTTAFVKFHKQGYEIDDLSFCERLMEDTGVMLSPGSKCFGGGREFKGYVRLGFCCETEILEKGLGELTEFMAKGYQRLPLADIDTNLSC